VKLIRARIYSEDSPTPGRVHVAWQNQDDELLNAWLVCGTKVASPWVYMAEETPGEAVDCRRCRATRLGRYRRMWRELQDRERRGGV